MEILKPTTRSWGEGETNGWKWPSDLMEIKDLVCLNDGRGTRIDVATGKEFALELTLVSRAMPGICELEVWEESTVGSDHYPIVCTVGRRRGGGVNGWSRQVGVRKGKVGSVSGAE